MLNQRVEIYNFNLELEYTFKTKNLFHNNFKLNNYEIAFKDYDKIHIYDYKTKRTKYKEIKFNIDELKNYCDGLLYELAGCLNLLSLNDDFFFIIAECIE